MKSAIRTKNMDPAQQDQTQKSDNDAPPASTTTSQSTSGAEVVAPKVDTKEIIAAVKAELQADEASKEKTYSEDELKDLLTQHKKEIANSIAGVSEEDSEQALRKAMLLNPSKFVESFSELVETRMQERLSAELSYREEESRAALKISRDRPELTSSERDLVSQYYELERGKSPDASPADLAAKALERFDLMMEEVGMGSAEERKAKRVTSVDSAGNSTKGSQEADVQSEEEAMQAEMDERMKRHKAIRNF